MLRILYFMICIKRYLYKESKIYQSLLEILYFDTEAKSISSDYIFQTYSFTFPRTVSNRGYKVPQKDTVSAWNGKNSPTVYALHIIFLHVIFLRTVLLITETQMSMWQKIMISRETFTLTCLCIIITSHK